MIFHEPISEVCIRYLVFTNLLFGHITATFWENRKTYPFFATLDLLYIFRKMGPLQSKRQPQCTTVAWDGSVEVSRQQTPDCTTSTHTTHHCTAQQSPQLSTTPKRGDPVTWKEQSLKPRVNRAIRRVPNRFLQREMPKVWNLGDEGIPSAFTT